MNGRVDRRRRTRSRAPKHMPENGKRKSTTFVPLNVAASVVCVFFLGGYFFAVFISYLIVNCRNFAPC